MAVTIQQIADKAGVSRGTVDRVLNHRGRVDPEVARRVEQIAEELGYLTRTQRKAGGRRLGGTNVCKQGKGISFLIFRCSLLGFPKPRTGRSRVQSNTPFGVALRSRWSLLPAHPRGKHTADIQAWGYNSE